MIEILKPFFIFSFGPLNMCLVIQRSGSGDSQLEFTNTLKDNLQLDKKKEKKITI